MNCQSIQKLIPLFLDQELSSHEVSMFQSHLKECPACQKELKAYQRSWELLKDWKDVEPSPGYVGRFFSELSQRTSWCEEVLKPFPERILQNFKLIFFKKRNVQAWVVSFVIVIVVLLGRWNYFQQGREENLANLNVKEIEFLEHFELARHFEVIENIDLLEDMDILENLDPLKS